MNLFRNSSLQRKQTLIIMLTSTAALLLACIGFVVYEAITFRAQMTRHLTTVAEMVGNNSTAALKFDDAPGAKEVLSALRAESNIVAAWLCLSNGSAFASYSRDGQAPGRSPKDTMGEGVKFMGDYLMLVRPIINRGERVGTVCLKSDLKALSARYRDYSAIVALLLAAST